MKLNGILPGRLPNFSSQKLHPSSLRAKNLYFGLINTPHQPMEIAVVNDQQWTLDPSVDYMKWYLEKQNIPVKIRRINSLENALFAAQTQQPDLVFIDYIFKSPDTGREVEAGDKVARAFEENGTPRSNIVIMSSYRGIKTDYQVTDAANLRTNFPRLCKQVLPHYFAESAR